MFVFQITAIPRDYGDFLIRVNSRLPLFVCVLCVLCNETNVGHETYFRPCPVPR